MKPSAVRLQPGVAFHLGPDGQWVVQKVPSDVLKDAEVSGHLEIEGYRCTVFDTPSGDMWAQKGPGTVASAFSEGSGIMNSLASRVATRHLRSAGKTHRCSECGIETDDRHDNSKCAFGPNEGHLHRFYRIDWHKQTQVPDGTVASRVAARFLEAKRGKKRDVTSLVKKIMERPGDDKKYEKEIAAYGKTVRKTLPKIETAFERLASDFEKVVGVLAEASHDKVTEHHVEIIRDQFGKAMSTVQVAASSLIRNLEKRAAEWDPDGKSEKKD